MGENSIGEEMGGIAYILGGRIYDLLDEYFERTRYSEVRRKMLSNIKGRVLDAGCGTGRNFFYYSKSAYALGIDNSESMLKIARERAVNLNNIEIKCGDITNLEIADNSFDSVVATFILCTMPKNLEKKALNELIRVAKPGARLYFLEYVYSKNYLRRFVMRATSCVPKLLYGIRFNSTLPIIKDENRLQIIKNELVYDDVLRLIVTKKR